MQIGPIDGFVHAGDGDNVSGLNWLLDHWVSKLGPDLALALDSDFIGDELVIGVL